MLSHLVVPLDVAATSFCYYVNDAYGTARPNPISLDVLSRIVEYARAQQLSVNFIYGKTLPPPEHAALIETIAHVKIMPLALHDAYPESVLVVNPRDDIGGVTYSRSAGMNLILRVPKDGLSDLASVVQKLAPRCERINVILLDLADYTDGDLKAYEAQLQSLLEFLGNHLRQGYVLELSSLTDRITLSGMRNCEAGITHLTVSPAGKFYLCPAVCYTNAADAVGSLDSGISIANAQLLQLDHAPICAQCDAFQCKRCLFLNKLLTLEINTPSRQQCVVSHLERDASRQLLELVHDLPLFRQVRHIPRLTYRDPLDKLLGEPLSAAGEGRDEELSEKELLWRIYNLQVEILERLRSPR